MNTSLFHFSLGLLLSSLAVSANQAKKEAPLPAATNPILWADVPDPSLLRIGDVYYMSSTTMHMSPGVPIMRSSNLIKWRMVSYAYGTLADTPALRLEQGKNAYGAGSWASSLRFHKGLFYVSTFSSTTGRTYIYSTADIEHGPWRENSFAPALHDASLHFEEDGRVYMVHGAGALRLTELNPDLSGIKAGGVDKIIIPNASLVAGPNLGLPAEGSQLFKIQGRYYLFNITWPQNGIRTQLVHRADSLQGPYEGRVFLADRGIAQGSLIDTPQGDWYACLFRDNGAVGRIPYLVPVQWQDGWPVAGTNGKVPDVLAVPCEGDGLENLVCSDDFERKPAEPELPLAWQWNHNPDNRLWSLSERTGFLRLTTGRVDGTLPEARNTLTQRTFGPSCSAVVAIEVSGMKEGDCAGLAAFQKKYGFVGIKCEKSAKSIVLVSAATEAPKELVRVPLNQERVQLRIDCNFREKNDKARFYYSLNGTDWTQLGDPMQMTYTLPHFVGYRFGLFNYATKATGGHVDFDFFHVSKEFQQPEASQSGK